MQKLLQKKEQFANDSQLKHTGDLILAYAQEAKGSTLTCIDYDTNKEVHIHLDAKKTAQENYKKVSIDMILMGGFLDVMEKMLTVMNNTF